MKNYRLMLFLIFLASLILVTTAVEAKSIDEREWIIVKTDNFTIHSAVSEKKTRDLLMHLEALRGMFVKLGTKSEYLVEKSTNIFVFAKSTDYEALGFSEDTAGMFLSELRQNFIVVNNSRYSEESQVILHEYVHFITQATSRFPYPKWWTEGYAEYTSSSRLSKKFFEFGLPLATRTYTLNKRKWLPWEDIIDTSNYAEYSPQQVRLFYAQSWLLVHYLNNRGSEERSVNASWNIYLEQLETGANPISAFENSFGLTLDELRQSVRLYVKKKRMMYFRIPTEAILTSFNPSVAKISRSDIQVFLGQIALRTDDAEQAQSWFEKSLRIVPDNSAALSGLALSHMMAGRYDEAEKQFERAIESNPNDPEALVGYAQFALERASTDDTWFTEGDYLDKAEKLLLKARDIAGATVEIDTYLAFTYLNQGKDPGSVSNLLGSVVTRSPSDQWPMLLLARVYQRLGMEDDAVDFAEMIIRSEHSENSTTSSARRIIADIRGDKTTSGKHRPRIAAPVIPPRE